MTMSFVIDDNINIPLYIYIYNIYNAYIIHKIIYSIKLTNDA